MRVFWIIVLVVLGLGAGSVLFDGTGDDPAPRAQPIVTVAPRPPMPSDRPTAESPDPADEADSAEPLAAAMEPGAEAERLLWLPILPVPGHRQLGDLTPEELRDMVRPPPRSRRPPGPRPATPPVTGSGTPDDPFEVSWELLVSAQHTFRPSRDERDLPPEIEALDGRFVRLSGFYIAPWGQERIEEALFMRYAWDGCCIGVPPNAYTSIDAIFAASRDRDDLISSTTGTLTGRLRIDPYEDRDWLLGLYVIDDGVLEVSTP